MSNNTRYCCSPPISFSASLLQVDGQHIVLNTYQTTETYIFKPAFVSQSGPGKIQVFMGNAIDKISIQTLDQGMLRLTAQKYINLARVPASMQVPRISTKQTQPHNTQRICFLCIISQFVKLLFLFSCFETVSF